MTILLVLIGGALGAVARYVLDGQVRQRFGRTFPWGTLTVNVLGAALLGALLGAGAGNSAQALVGTGFLGALTTFSTFELDTVHLLQDGSFTKAVVNAIVSLALGLLVFAGAYALF